ncbi:MAG: isopentenyl-diphosphate Delta-isomerase [Cyclobacteriaceae bacterium]|nr:isopentenyl-diphosphate Delta-isomerase [Cyclobacteriaceae bacterium]
MRNDEVILVDHEDRQTGIMDKMEAHEKGLLHRAYSVFVFNEKNELLLQKRAEGKYHSPGLWTNTCCSHPQPGEDIMKSARDRLFYEMGIKGGLTYHSKITYKAVFENGLTEHEVDHLYTCVSNAFPSVNPEEVSDWKYVSLLKVADEINQFPDHFTPWFKLIVAKKVLIPDFAGR